MSISTLTERAMLANISISLWQGYRLDKEASLKVTEAAGAKSDAARVNKHLVSKEALAPVMTAANTVRTHFYTNTLPWRDNGDRILPRNLYLKFIESHEALKREFDDQVDNFLAVAYPEARSQAEFRMGDLFKPDDYPHPSDLRRRFAVNLDFAPLSTAQDFRVDIDQEHVERIKASIESAAEQRIIQAQQDIWSRIGEAVGRFQERMADPKAVFRDTTVDNIHELVELVPGLNVLDDPNIELVRGLLEKMMTGVDAKTIRKNPDVREELAGEAKEIMDKMSSFAKAFGASA